MRVSFNQTTSPNVRDTNGYGYAAKMCKQSLEELGHEISWRDSTADVEINFIQPDNWHWAGPYRIGYLPWESTGLLPGWLDKLNNECDELWTPSPVIAEWFREAGVTRDVKIYQHGVESLWEPYIRPLDRFHALHIGAEALRKGGNDAIHAFQDTLWDEEATLILKMQLQQFNMHDTEHIKIVKDKVSIDQLISIYRQAHLFLYPSWGEGFGLTPLQAMATGMPVLITRGWAPYEYLLPDSMLINSTLTESPWQNVHPGKMFQPDQNDLRDKLRAQFDEREHWQDWAMGTAFKVHEDYNWKTLTEKAFSHLL